MITGRPRPFRPFFAVSPAVRELLYTESLNYRLRMVTKARGRSRCEAGAPARHPYLRRSSRSRARLPRRWRRR